MTNGDYFGKGLPKDLYSFLHDVIYDCPLNTWITSCFTFELNRCPFCHNGVIGSFIVQYVRSLYYIQHSNLKEKNHKINHFTQLKPGIVFNYVTDGKFKNIIYIFIKVKCDDKMMAV